MGSKLQQYGVKSGLMLIRIKYGEELFKFNLFAECQINENDIEKELTELPSSYSYIIMLHKKLIGRAKRCEDIKKRVEAERYIYYLTSNQSPYYRENQKFPTVRLAEAYTEKDSKYREAVEDWLKSVDELNTIEAAVRSFECKKDLLQTLSANLRRERV